MANKNPPPWRGISFFIEYRLFVHLELGVAILEESVDLLGCSNTGIDIGLGSLGTHLLRCREITALELLKLVVSIGHDVGHELLVLALSHQLDQTSLVDDFLTGCIHEDTTLLHLTYQSIVDALLGLRSSRDME